MNIKSLISKLIKKIADNDEKDTNKFIEYRYKIINSTNNVMVNIYRLKYDRILYKNNAFIPIRSSIEEGLTLPHGLNGIFISQGAKIGKNCIIFHQVTIGSNTLSETKKNGAPKIGNNVFIGAGAKIIGDVTIGNNVRIGANCVIVENVPDNCTIVMNKPRIINHKTQKNNEFKKYNTN